MTDLATTEDEQDDSPKRPVTRRWGIQMIAWILVACWLLWALARLAGVDRASAFSSIVIPAMAIVPYVAAGVVIPLAVAALTRNWPALAAAVVVAAMFAGIALPRAFGNSRPHATGPELRILTANLRFGAAGDASLVDLVRRTGAEVLSVQEFTPEAADRLDAAGMEKLMPYRVIDPRGGPEGSGLYSRYPLTQLPDRGPTTFAMVSADLAVPGTAPVRMTAAHPPAPLGRDAAKWRHDLREIPPATPHGQVGIVAGDLNATLDHEPLRRLIGKGFTDAADATGQGLVPTFRPWPPITIDHVLADKRCAVERVKVFYQSGSDHRALFTELRLP
ncbi:endonuclease/exonuclease/phosphatase family protein [Actinomadura sp. DC4]|uniref:endonuclease/exonuclease/phosphatase family protein n=1 Tax=Actinomadura sp. DC4 TaxID=3055069 RepID=UPI0025B2107B|nr:endonuclease/exonuclease/phosphatase family protein [Actinomadura sp. DC4]MDN3360007.1 endonuclease/exonuclease/phosphatase family protein [Actinomadura sp. DC4]